MKKIHAVDVLTWNLPFPSLVTFDIVRRFDGRSLTALEICDWDIPAFDKFILLLRSEVLGKVGLRLVCCDLAEHVLPHFEVVFTSNTSARKAIETARLYAEGRATLSELRAAKFDSYGWAVHAGSIDRAAYNAALAAVSCCAVEAHTLEGVALHTYQCLSGLGGDPSEELLEIVRRRLSESQT